MSPEDRQKLKDAFTAAVNSSPYANEVIAGIATNEGKPMTRRELVEGTLKMEEFYEEVDAMLSRGETTIDELIGHFERDMKKSMYDPS